MNTTKAKSRFRHMAPHLLETFFSGLEEMLQPHGWGCLGVAVLMPILQPREASWKG